MLLGSFQRPHLRRSKAGRRQAIGRACLEALESRRLLSFAPAVNYAVGTQPQDVVTADFNNDGRLDLATGNATFDNWETGNTVSVRLGNANGTFQPAQTSAAGVYPDSIAVGDFNGDGKTDLVATAGWQTVAILIGNGNGTFQPPAFVPIAGYGAALSVAVGDLDADGKMDLAVASAYDLYDYGWVEVLRGDGAGGFVTSGLAFIGADSGMDLAIADVNGDTKLDVVAALYDRASVAVLIGNGAGSLTWTATAATGPIPKSVAVGDMTGDGVPDLVTAGQYVDVIPGNGNGTFGTRIPHFPKSHTDVQLADFNRDGKLDAAVTTDWTVDGAVNVLLGNGTGALVRAASSQIGTFPAALAVGDFNGDARPDVAAANSGSHNASVLLNDGNWSTTPPALSINNVSVIEGNTGTANAVFTVTLAHGPAAANVTVNYSTDDWAARAADGDYVPTSGTLTFTPGQTSKTVTVAVKGDYVGEEDELFLVRLSGAMNAELFEATGLGTITDDEPRISLSPPAAAVTEGDSGTTPMVFMATLSPASTQTVTVDAYAFSWSAEPGVDFDVVSPTLSFAPGETSKQVSVPIRGDLIDEYDEVVGVYLSNAVGAVVASGFAEGTILDNDAPAAVVISNVSRAEGNSGTTPFTFTVSLLTPSAKPLSVSYGTSAGTATISGNNPDYQPKSGTLNFAPGQTMQTVTVSVFGDTRNEQDETFAINLGSPNNATIADGQGIATILNDESRGKTWIGPAIGGSWSTASNWSPSGVPAGDSFVTIAGATVVLPASATVSELTLKSGAALTVGANGSRVFRTAGLYLDAGTTLNLGDNDMILDYAAGSADPLGTWIGSGYDGVSGLIARGYNYGAWDGDGVVTTTSSARAGLTTLAPVDASELLGLTGSQTALWHGQTVDATTVVVKYTYAGDVNLDGLVDGADYGTLDNWVQFTGTSGYANGDVNFDGVIDGADYGTLDNSIQLQGAPL